MADETSPAALQAAAIQALTQRFRDRALKAWDTIRAAEQDVLDRWPTLGKIGRRRALRTLQTTVTREVAAVSEAAAALPAALQDAGTRGASSAALAANYRSPTIGVPQAVKALASDTYSDVLAATRHVNETTKELVRTLAREHVADKLAFGETPAQAAAKLAADLSERGITAVVYADGSRHGLADYTDMLTRTKSAEAYQEGGFAQTEALGIQYVEIMDGPGCGWTSHTDPRKANGLIITVDEARLYPLSHPRCRRVASPRPDVVNPATATPIGPQHSAAEIAAASRQTVSTSAAATRSAARRSRSGALRVSGQSAAQQRAARRVAQRSTQQATD